MSDQPHYTGMATMEAVSGDLKFRIDRDSFADAVEWAAKSLPQRATAPILNGVLLSGRDNTLTVSGYDYEVSAESSVNADVESDGTVLVSGRLLAAITRSLPNKVVSFASGDGTRVNLTCGSSKFSLPTMAVEDYPQLPVLPDESGSITSDELYEAISQVAVAASKDDSNPMLMGVRVEISGSTMTLAATDRFRLAVRELRWSPVDEAGEAELLIPAKTLSEAVKVGSDGSDIRLSLGGAQQPTGLFGLSGANKHITARMLDAEFPKYRNLLPSEHTSVAMIDVAPLVDSVKRVALVSDRGALIRMDFTAQSVRLSAYAAELGQAEEDIDIDYVGEPLSIAFSPTYLADGLAAVRSPRVSIGFTSPTRPAVLRPATKDDTTPMDGAPYPAAESDYAYLLMPVKLPTL